MGRRSWILSVSLAAAGLLWLAYRVWAFLVVASIH